MNFSRIDPRVIAESLYDFNKPGAVSLGNVLPISVCENIINRAETYRLSSNGEFITPQRERGRVIQEMQICYLERLSYVPEELKRVIFPVAAKLEEFFQCLYPYIVPLAKDLRDTPLLGSSFNSVGIHYYPAQTGGITPHRDFANSLNLIVIFVLSGDAELYTCSNRNGDSAKKLDCSPGSMIILRAPRNDDEQKFRPFHYLTSSSVDRYSLIFRQEVGPAGAGYA
jgi:hypothetical protein